MRWLNLFSGFDKGFYQISHLNDRKRSNIYWQSINQDINRAWDKLVKIYGSKKTLR